MKYLFTLMLAALLGAGTMQAQVTVTCEGKEVKNGDNLIFYATEDEFGEAKTEAKPAAPYLTDPTITSETTPYKIKVEVTTSDNAKQSGLYWCGITGLCADIKGGFESRTADITSFLGLNMNLHGTFTKGIYKTMTADVAVKHGLQTLITFRETFIYDDPSGIGEAAGEAVGVTILSGRTLSYLLPGTQTADLTIYGTDGKLVRHTTLSGKRGTISLSDLQRGVYIYRLSQAGKVVKSDKVVLN